MRMPSSSSFVSFLWLTVAAANLFPCCGHPHPGESRSGFCCSSCKQTDSVCSCATFYESWGLGFANFRNEKVERFTVWQNSQPEQVPPFLCARLARMRSARALMTGYRKKKCSHPGLSLALFSRKEVLRKPPKRREGWIELADDCDVTKSAVKKSNKPTDFCGSLDSDSKDRNERPLFLSRKVLLGVNSKGR